MNFQEWLKELRDCLQDLGAMAYDEAEAGRLFNDGYSPAEAAGELVND